MSGMQRKEKVMRAGRGESELTIREHRSDHFFGSLRFCVLPTGILGEKTRE